MKLILLQTIDSELEIEPVPKPILNNITKMRHYFQTHASRLSWGRENRDWKIRAQPLSLIPMYAVHNPTGQCLVIK